MDDATSPRTECERPLGRIGLSLSGGGFRAAAFHLGALDTLHRLGLLEDVAVLSTVSGGSLPGAAYALAAGRGEPFEQLFRDHYRFLASGELAALAFELFRSQSPRTPSQARTLIKATAEALDRSLFRGARLGELFASRGHLDEVIVNATELRTGVPFRFRASTNTKARIGNGNVSLTRGVAGQLRLADVVAASACFPGGFEPLTLPHDFNWSEEAPNELPGELQTFQPLALMDGGATDNQGVGSVRLADRRDGLDLALVVISDTDRATETLYEPEPGRARRGPTLALLASALALAGALLLASGTSLVADAVILASERGVEFWYDLLYLWLPAAACLGLGVATLLGLYESRRAVVAHLPPRLRSSAGLAMAGLRWGEAAHLAAVRARSLVALTAHVFTRRIRRQVFDAAYEDEVLRDRLVANLITRLPRWSQGQPLPSATLLEVARRAGRMPTTLWFEQQDQLDDLVATGQATLCHALLCHLERTGQPTEAADDLTARARALWDRLNEEPHALVRERLG